MLLQAGQGGGLASLGGTGTETVLGGRQAVTILTKASWWCGGLFLLISLLLSLVPRSGSSSALHSFAGSGRGGFRRASAGRKADAVTWRVAAFAG